jgi:hypothetical protein
MADGFHGTKEPGPLFSPAIDRTNHMGADKDEIRKSRIDGWSIYRSPRDSYQGGV